MSRILSFRGELAMGLEERIRLSTKEGHKGYRIVKFQLMSTLPYNQANEYVGKVTKLPDDNITSEVHLSDHTLLAVNYYVSGRYSDDIQNSLLIFDNEIFNQDIYVNITDGTGGTTECNYYIELEQMTLDANEATVATLKNIKNRG